MSRKPEVKPGGKDPVLTARVSMRAALPRASAGLCPFPLALEESREWEEGNSVLCLMSLRSGEMEGTETPEESERITWKSLLPDGSRYQRVEGARESHTKPGWRLEKGKLRRKKRRALSRVGRGWKASEAELWPYVDKP